MKKLLFFLPDLFLYVLKSLSVRLYYHLRSLCICIYFSLFLFFLFHFSSLEFLEEFGWFGSFLDAKAQIIFRHAMLHLTVLRNEENEAVYNKPTGNESWRFTHHSFFFSPSLFSLFSFSFSLSFFAPLFSLSFPPLLVLPSRVPSVSRSNLFNGIPPNAARFTPRSSFVYLLLAFARALKHRLFFVLNIKLVEGKNFNDREYVI